LIDYLLFYISLNGDVTVVGEGLKNLGLSSALKQGGIFIVPRLL
jgi:hypothetical protein